MIDNKGRSGVMNAPYWSAVTTTLRWPVCCRGKRMG